MPDLRPPILPSPWPIARAAERLFLTLFALAAIRCGSSPKSLVQTPVRCKELPVEIFLEGRPQLNPNPKGQPMPVEIRIYLLKNRLTLDQLDFDTVWQSGEKTLAGDLVRSEYTTVYPGNMRIYSIMVPGATNFVALVAVFRSPTGKSWVHVADLRDKISSCEDGALHTIVHAVLFDNTITTVERAPAEKE
jgi:type VI secretion system VasD/TssJ family lipoprotein